MPSVSWSHPRDEGQPGPGHRGEEEVLRDHQGQQRLEGTDPSLQVIGGDLCQGKKIGPAIDNLRDMLSIAVDQSDNAAKSEAALKLGLLFYKPGPRSNQKQSADFLG